jgi:hypothetical protein
MLLLLNSPATWPISTRVLIGRVAVLFSSGDNDNNNNGVGNSGSKMMGTADAVGGMATTR